MSFKSWKKHGMSANRKKHNIILLQLMNIHPHSSVVLPKHHKSVKTFRKSRDHRQGFSFKRNIKGGQSTDLYNIICNNYVYNQSFTRMRLQKNNAVNLPSMRSTYSCDNTPNNSTSNSSPRSWPTQNSELCTGTLLRMCERYTKPSGNSRENWTACIVIHLNRGMVILILY